VRENSLDSAAQAVRASVAALRMGATEGGIISLHPAGQIGGEHCVDKTQLTQLNAALQTDADHHDPLRNFYRQLTGAMAPARRGRESHSIETAKTKGGH